MDRGQCPANEAERAKKMIGSGLVGESFYQRSEESEIGNYRTFDAGCVVRSKRKRKHRGRCHAGFCAAKGIKYLQFGVGYVGDRYGRSTVRPKSFEPRKRRNIFAGSLCLKTFFHRIRTTGDDDISDKCRSEIAGFVLPKVGVPELFRRPRER